MQRKQTDPAGHMYRIAVRMAAMLRNFVGNVVDDNNAVEQYQSGKDEQEPRRNSRETWFISLGRFARFYCPEPQRL